MRTIEFDDLSFIASPNEKNYSPRMNSLAIACYPSVASISHGFNRGSMEDE